MSFYNKNWVYQEYKELYVDITGADLTDAEDQFLKKYFDPYNDDGGKKIYYMAVFRLKRGWHQFLVYFLIAKNLKKDFNKIEGLETLVVLHKHFAKKMLFNAIKAYCKITD